MKRENVFVMLGKVCTFMLILVIGIYCVGITQPVYAGTLSLLPTDDTYVDYQYSTAINGAAEQLQTNGVYPIANGTKYIFMKFDLKSLTGRVKSAKLNFYVCDRSAPGYTNFMNVYKITQDAWVEGTASWTNNPPYPNMSSGLPSDAGQIGQSNKQISAVGWYYFDIANWVNNRLATDNKLATVRINNVSGNGRYNIYSKEASGINEQYRPYLEIEYDTFATSNLKITDIAGNAPVISPDNQVKVSADLANPTFTNKTVQLILGVYNNTSENSMLEDIKIQNITVPASTTNATSTLTGSFTYTLPSNINSNYSLKAFVWDSVDTMKPYIGRICFPTEN